MATTTFIPLTWKNMDLTDPLQVTILQKQLSAWGDQVQNIIGSSAGLASVLNGSASINGNALKYVNKQLGTVTTNQTVDCTGAAGVAISITLNTVSPISLTLTNLDMVVPVQIIFSNANGGSVRTLQILASTPASVNYSTRGKVAGVSAGLANWATTGLGIQPATTYIFFGSSTGPANAPFLYLPAS